MQHIAVFGSAQRIRWRLNHIHSMKYAEVISASIAANSVGIDYRLQCFLGCTSMVSLSGYTLRQQHV